MHSATADTPRAGPTTKLEPADVVRDLTAQALQDLLPDSQPASDDLSVSLPDASPGRTTMVSVLGANGPGLQLLATLQAEPELLAALHPLAEQKLSQAELEDWARELNNMLVGRVKNRLLAYGCELMLGVPSLVVGTELQTPDAPGLACRKLGAVHAAGLLQVSVGVKTEPGFELSEPTPDEPRENTAMLEGAMALF